MATATSTSDLIAEPRPAPPEPRRFNPAMKPLVSSRMALTSCIEPSPREAVPEFPKDASGNSSRAG